MKTDTTGDRKMVMANWSYFTTLPWAGSGQAIARQVNPSSTVPRGALGAVLEPRNWCADLYYPKQSMPSGPRALE